jgi:hypothetical protein
LAKEADELPGHGPANEADDVTARVDTGRTRRDRITKVERLVRAVSIEDMGMPRARQIVVTAADM